MLQLRPGLVASYDIQPGNGVGLFWDTTHTHLLTYLLSPDPHGELCVWWCVIVCDVMGQKICTRNSDVSRLRMQRHVNACLMIRPRTWLSCV